MLIPCTDVSSHLCQLFVCGVYEAFMDDENTALVLRDKGADILKTKIVSSKIRSRGCLFHKLEGVNSSCKS